MHLFHRHQQNEFLESIDSLDLLDFLPEKFTYFEWEYSNWVWYWEIRYKDDPDYYLRYSILDDTYYLETIHSPWKWSVLLIALFHQAFSSWKNWILVNARTNDEAIKDQSTLEDWYRRFWFETISRDIDGTKMRASVANRPLIFRLKELLAKIHWNIHSTLSPPSASTRPQGPLSP
jgi:hypothetical protein